MLNIKEPQLQVPLKDKHTRLFQDVVYRRNQGDLNELWLAQPFAQKIVKSITSSSSSVSPDID